MKAIRGIVNFFIYIVDLLVEAETARLEMRAKLSPEGQMLFDRCYPPPWV